jgi:hypothetical protein
MFRKTLNRFCLLTFFLFTANMTYAIWPYERVQPRLKSEVKSLTPAQAKELLTNSCIGEIRQGNYRGPVSFQCDNPVKGEEWFMAEGVIFGHFLSPTSEDALVSGTSGETHPQFAGGTLLLTKKNNKWHRVWQKSSVISRHCIRLQLKTGRDILLCEEEDGGMGHTYHLLYSLDATSPKNPFKQPLIVADSFTTDMCQTRQTQSIVQIDSRKQILENQTNLTVKILHGFKRLSRKDYVACVAGKPFPDPPLRTFEIDFLLKDSDFQIAPWSINAQRYFSKH